MIKLLKKRETEGERKREREREDEREELFKVMTKREREVNKKERDYGTEKKAFAISLFCGHCWILF